MSTKTYNSLVTISVIIFIVIVPNKCNVSANESLSKYVKICSRNDVDLNNCVLESVMLLKPHLFKGIPELDIPSCEPLFLSEVKLVQGHGVMAMNSEYRNVHLWGFSNFTVHNMDIDLEKKLIKFDVNIPNLTMKSNYFIDGKILLFPIVGNGLFYANYSDVNLKVTITLEKVEIDHKIYIRGKEISLKLKIDKADIRLDDLFSGDEILGKATNDFINKNWNTISEEVNPTIENMMVDYLESYTNKFFNKYPLDVLFPDK
ncbi:circadian clock-controlled protein daywake-like [Arctopsyche grandis]|uniref:circadian clock-controlled protein daywake-like n=1 Tax=Arctopsyche grandis TaxID=121162 RepID=UPI00406D76F4